ncbi:MAG TPA: glycoside hydrolase family 99-like domain-containing protein [Thermodesulfobacteriota bacterium]|nr:glycoside hydrolase family 99-like domain-containing protein [Thermodesulfobacteriota bacterium]
MPLKYFKYQALLLLLFMVTAYGCSSSSPPQNLSKPESPPKVLIGAFYYLWYPGNWREGYINGFLRPPQLPALGEYDSTDLKTIEQQIAWSSQYGINFWAVSWWPGHPELDTILREKTLRARNIGDLKFCIFYETAGLGLVEDRIVFTPEKTQKMIADFKYLALTYFNHPSYLKVKGKPVVILYLTRTFSGNYPEAIALVRKNLKKMGIDLYLIADEIFWYVMRSVPLPPSTQPNLNRIKLFDAVTAYNMYDWAKPKQMGYGRDSTFLQEVHDIYLEYRSALGREVPLVPSIIPGYNDRGVRLSEKHPVIPRRFAPDAEEGSFFQRALKQTVLPFVDPENPMVLITSFNEWNEGTQVEPTVESPATSSDRSDSHREYSQGYAYQGYGKKYLSIIQNTFVAVTGRITDDKDGKSLAGVELKIYEKGILKARSSSDAHGYFNLFRLHLPLGSYELKVRPPGYGEATLPVTVEEDKTARISVRLKKE